MTPHDTTGFVELTVDGQRHTLFHGDLIGRLWSAALMLNDVRVSEAHAMISLRGRDWRLLALRGRFLLDGVAATSGVLAEGTTITFAPGLEATVSRVVVPSAVLALEADGLARRVLPGVTSLFGGSSPRIEAGWQPDADDYLWPTGNGWMRTGPLPVGGGDTWVIGGATFRATLDELPRAHAATEADPGHATPLRILARYDTVHIQRRVDTVLVLSGHSARLVSELVAMGQPCSWESLAVALWGDIDRAVLRRRWDMQLSRLRSKLSASGVRTNLIRPDGTGLIELVLGPADEAIDDT